MIIKNADVFMKDAHFEKKDVVISGQTITDIIDPQDSAALKQCFPDEDIVDASGCYLIPGLTDIHFHGCMGHDFCEGTKEAIDVMAAYEASQGVTTICPATMTLAKETLSAICKNAAQYSRTQDTNSDEKAVLVGINLEGPFISLKKKGAQNPEFIHCPDIDMFRQLKAESEDLVKTIAIAPEEPGAMEFIDTLKDDVVISIAHTTADYDTAKAAIDHGAHHVTHLYNAMPPLAHREPGVIGAACENDACHVELICDGIHIHPATVRTTFKMFGDDRIILISDSMEATGMPDGQYALGGLPVTVKGNHATLADGTLAGSATNLMDCLRTVVKCMGIPLESAVKCAAVNPAKEIGIFDRYGSIENGKMANLVLLKKDSLDTAGVVLRGKRIL